MRFGRVLVPLALAGVLLAGCGTNTDEGRTPADSGPADNGVAALEPDAILAKAKTALVGAKSYSLKGEMTVDKSKMKLDIKISGDDTLGTMTSDGATIELLRVGGQMYIRLDEKFWEQSAGADSAALMVELINGRWAKLSGKDDDLAGFFEIADPNALLKADGTLTKGETKTINGIKAIGLVDGSADNGTLYVATTGEPYPLVMQGGKADGEKLTFGDFGKTFDDIKAPTAKEVVDLDKLVK